MRRLKKSIFNGGAAGLILLLALIRCAFPRVADPADVAMVLEHAEVDSLGSVAATDEGQDAQAVPVQNDGDVKKEPKQEPKGKASEKPGKASSAKLSEPLAVHNGAPVFVDGNGNRVKRRIISVPEGYDKAFPDLQDVQLAAAQKWGVKPVKNREQAEALKDELVYVGSNAYYALDDKMTSSIPYLVPRAADLLHTIGRNFIDSLAAKGLPAHKIIVNSVLRTDADVTGLRKKGNQNATKNSCHRYGTTFDIAYVRYKTIAPPGEKRRAVRDDTLKFVLSEVLKDLRKGGRCYVKHERKQGCFHITVR